MPNSESYKPRSISRTLSAGLIITLLLVAGLSLGVNFILSSRKAKAELETRAEEYISALTDALKVPLWNFSEETIETICASYAQNEFVAKLWLEDQKGAVLFNKEKADQRLVALRSGDIFYEGNRIGRVYIALASGYYTAVNRQLFQSLGLTIVIMIGALLVMTDILLRRFLKRPMSRFIKMVDTYAAGESDAFKQGIPYREFDPLVDVLDEMGEKIASQMRSIRELNEDLEKRVEERTAELRKLSEAIEQSPVTVMITDKNGIIEYVNPMFTRVTGYSAKEAIGQNPRIFKSGNHPDSFYKDLWDTILSGKTWRGEILNRKKSDEKFWESTSISAIKNDQGEITHFVAAKQDITDQKRAEQAIMESRAKYRDLVENANCIIFQMDTRGNLTFFNRFAQDFFGYNEAEIIGRNIVGTIVPATDSAGRNLEVMIQNLVKHPEKYADNENENMRRNGELVWVAWTNRAIYDDENHLSEILCIGIDRTAQKKAEEIVKNSEERLAQIINFLPDPTFVIDREGKVDTWNQAMENLTGIAAADMVGKGNYEYALPFYGERRPILIDLVRQWNPEYEKKYLSIKKDGEKLVSESYHPNLGDGGLHLSGNASLIYDAAGKVAGAIESLRDITEQKAADEALRASEEKSRLLLESVGEGIFGVDLDGKVTFINPAASRMLGCRPEELIRNDIHEKVHHSHADGSPYSKNECPMYLSHTDGTAHQIADEVLWRKDGTSFPVEYTSMPIKKSGQVVGAVITFMDINERKQMEEELRRNVEELGRFNKLAIGREIKMIQLKEEINELRGQINQDKRYKIVT